MDDPYMKSYLTAVLSLNPSRRYSPAAITPVATRLARQYEERARTSPGWLTTQTLAEYELAVRKAARALASRCSLDARKERRRALFYATARCEAFRMVLNDVEPGATTLKRLPLPAGMARKLAEWRYEHKWRSRRLESLEVTYEELRVTLGEAKLSYDRISAELSLAQDEKEFDLAGRRQARGLGARSTRATAHRLHMLKDRRDHAKDALRRAQARFTSVRNKRARCRARIELLEQRIADNEKF